ncbi:hypothetical protein TH19_19575 [Thalassospira profundimaris]|uniref:Cytochrome c domain-containing protein n=2 Tax=Thalassospira TaxID=168934 RepID=A0A367VZZ3_9PROT|nr:hypothetical protein TH19_19575 [Thalassospira profundimaris]
MSVMLGLAILLLSMPFGAHAQNAALSANPARGEIPVFVEDYDTAEFCSDGSDAGPCTVAPVDVPEFDANFIYRFLAYHAQRPFDRFSWQAFTSLMAPLDEPEKPALWQSFPTQRDLFSEVGYPNPACADDLPDGYLLLASYLQTTGDILVDQAGNFVLYETRINPVATSYIRENGLDTRAGRTAFANSGKPIAFPLGQVSPTDRVIEKTDEGAENAIPPAGPGDMGAQLLKFAWRILPDDAAAAPSVPHGYYTRPARISLGADQTLDGRPACLDVTVGLVGMHLVQRVTSGNGDRWVWSSFEHIDNVPLAANARRPNSIITDTPFAEGCLAPASKTSEGLPVYAFYGGKTGKGHVANDPTPGDLKWADRQPFARDPSGKPVVSPDIVRCWRLFSGTAEANFVWQRKLDGTVWQNYMLLGTQWIGNPGGATFGVGEVPRYLTNSVLESFMQHQSDATCLGCHSRALTDAGQPSNFTFLLNPPS